MYDEPLPKLNYWVSLSLHCLIGDLKIFIQEFKGDKYLHGDIMIGN
jgi:hypothetical protein